jgi:hypothetical protein
MKHTLLMACAGALLLAACGTSTTSPYSTEQLDTFASCTTEAGLVMYGTERCPHCKDQKKLFGDAFAQINYVDCDQQDVICQAAGVTGYPTWIGPNGLRLQGTQSLENLSVAGGCSLE